VLGPGYVYPMVAAQLATSEVLTLRLDYRRPNHVSDCLEDVRAALAFLGAAHGRLHAVIVGWSFGGAVALRAAQAWPGIIVGAATVASQTASIGDVAAVAPAPLLLLHGTADTCLSDRCSRSIYAAARHPKELVLYDGDDHGLTRHSTHVAHRLASFVGRCIDNAVEAAAGGAAHQQTQGESSAIKAQRTQQAGGVGQPPLASHDRAGAQG
jgi:alpha/beta superfamily hydrolase